jgi:hypothetical protein
MRSLMSSPTNNAFLDDPLLMVFDALPANKMLHEAQVALLLGCKTRWKNNAHVVSHRRM